MILIVMGGFVRLVLFAVGAFFMKGEIQFSNGKEVMDEFSTLPFPMVCHVCY